MAQKYKDRPLSVFKCGQSYGSGENKSMIWPAIIKYMGHSRASDTRKQDYQSLDKAKQTAFKKYRYTVMGRFEGDRRRLNELEHRSAIVIDVDSGGEINALLKHLSSLPALQGVEHIIKSSTTHTAENSKVHIVIPLKEDETDFDRLTFIIGTIMLEQIGEQYFEAGTDGKVDLCSLNPVQGYNQPRIFLDSEPTDFVFEHLNTDGTWFDTKEFVGQYPGWEKKNFVGKLKSSGHMLQDPRQKPGVIGATCNELDMQEAIERFPQLADIYEPGTADDGSTLQHVWTYKPGSSVNGLKFPEREYLQEDGTKVTARLHGSSYQGTDPVNVMGGSRPQNMFDIIRIALFGILDVNVVNENTPVHKLPSYEAAIKLLEADEKIATEMVAREEERQVEIAAAFAKEGSEEQAAWLQQLDFLEDGSIDGTYKNAAIILQNDPSLVGLCTNTMRNGDKWVKGKQPEWSKGTLDQLNGRRWIDYDESEAYDLLVNTYKIEIPKQKFDMCIALAAGRKHFHPVQCYLQQLPPWDGVPRIEGTLHKYFLVEDNVYTREVSAIIFTAAVARAMSPGCVFEHLPILAGPGKTGKTQFLRDLAPHPDWHSSSLPEKLSDTKKFVEMSGGKWILEMGELEQLIKTDKSTLKKFFSETVDTLRLAYGRNAGDYPRSAIMLATFNPESEPYFLSANDSGNRRYWPLYVQNEPGNFPHPRNTLIKERDLLWAEALARFEADGLNCTLLSGEAEELATAAQRAVEDRDSWADDIGNFLDTPIEQNIAAEEGFYVNDEGMIQRVDAQLLLHHAISGGTRKQGDRAAARRINKLLSNAGWKASTMPLQVTRKTDFCAARRSRCYLSS